MRMDGFVKTFMEHQLAGLTIDQHAEMQGLNLCLAKNVTMETALVEMVVINAKLKLVMDASIIYMENPTVSPIVEIKNLNLKSESNVTMETMYMETDVITVEENQAGFVMVLLDNNLIAIKIDHKDIVETANLSQNMAKVVMMVI